MSCKNYLKILIKCISYKLLCESIGKKSVVCVCTIVYIIIYRYIIKYINGKGYKALYIIILLSALHFARHSIYKTYIRHRYIRYI